jgi:hypothetical protein
MRHLKFHMFFVCMVETGFWGRWRSERVVG